MTKAIELKKEVSHKYADILRVPGEPVLVIQTTAASVPLAGFKEIFTEAGRIIEQEGITKLVFDKRSFRVFDPEAMEWYFTQWKEGMFDHGLRTHRKIMPASIPFKYSVDQSRKSIYERFPNGKFRQMDIQYVASVEEAVAK
ncbi:MAG: hypothetical protein WA958_10720 [Tunicatimonas sp.]